MNDDFERRLAAADLSDEEFEHRYGPLARLAPAQAATLLEGMQAPWWIVGGWAVEAFTGIERPHGDVDVCILAKDLRTLIAHFIDSHHLWAVGSGSMCPLLFVEQPLPKWAGQVWIRKDATAPWLLDVLVTPDQNGRWVFRRDPSVVRDLGDVTWVADDGIAYQNPEVTLAFKARHARGKDDADLDAALATLAPPARAWLADTIERLHPGHRWLARIEA